VLPTRLKKIASMECGENEYIDTYLHGDAKTGVAVRVHAEDGASLESRALRANIHDLCLQIAAGKPAYIQKDDVPADLVEERERVFNAEISEDPKLREKPAPMIAGIVSGKLRKYFSETCLYEQRFIKDDKSTVAGFLCKAEAEAGTRLKVTGFIYAAIGKE
jgi:elongation factor Ts